MGKIQVLGPGCAKCVKLADNAAAAVEALGGGYEIEKVTDLAAIASFGVLLTPALVVDGEVKASGKLLDVDEIKAFLQQA